MKIVELPTNKMSKRLTDARFDSVDIPELIGLCKGVLADGTINLSEAEYIQDWLSEHPDILPLWPAKDLTTLLGTALDDGVLTDNEQTQLVALLEEITGEPASVLFF
ncbi:MAG: hypothetical protein AB8C02_03545 [Halioglobus sp.]